MAELLSATQAYLSMVRFIRDYWERGGQRPGELVLFMSYAEPGKWPPTSHNPLGTGDPAAWSDWLAAVRAVTETPLP